MTKSSGVDDFGSDAPKATLGFIRVRKRTLHPKWRSRAKASMSFDLVRGVCVNGKARHQFVLGLGSQKSGVRYDTVGFWDRAIFRMTRHGIEPERRQRLIAEMVRKGARLPSPDECQKYVENDRALAQLYGWKPRDSARVNELFTFMRC